MRYRDVIDVDWFKSDRGELVRERLVQMVDDQLGQRRPAFAIVQCGFGNAGIPEQPFTAVLYQPTRRRERNASSDILAGSPDRLVVRERVTAIEPIKSVGEARCGRLCDGEPASRTGDLADHQAAVGKGIAFAGQFQGATRASSHAAITTYPPTASSSPPG